jgi:two-component system sensor kinase FixL
MATRDQAPEPARPEPHARQPAAARETTSRFRASPLLLAAAGRCVAWIKGQLRRAQRHRHAAAVDTTRAELDSRLRASDARWHAIVDAAVDGIIVIDARGRVESFNRAAERLFGYSESEVVGQNVSLLMPAPYRDEHDGYIQRYLATGEPRIIGKGREVSGRRKDGAVFPLQLSVAEVKLGGESKFTGIVHDLSARVAMEEQLREQASLVRLGEMAAVIAHEVKNPLAAIRGAIQVIAQRAPSTGPDAAVMHEIVSRIDSLDGLMKELLLFARPPTARPSPTDIITLLETTAGLFTRDPAMLEVHVDVTGSAPPVPVDPHMLQIVFQNLLLNGAQSMAGRGAIDVRVSTENHWCDIAVSDHGPGIPADIRDRVFTPFFTTKARGSGLGLPTAKRLIEAHGGDIGLECPSSGGTTVRIRLPLDSPPGPGSSASR